MSPATLARHQQTSSVCRVKEKVAKTNFNVSPQATEERSDEAFEVLLAVVFNKTLNISPKTVFQFIPIINEF